MDGSAVDRQHRALAEGGTLHRQPRLARLQEAADADAVEEERSEQRKSRGHIVLDRGDAVGHESSAIVQLAVDLQWLGRGTSLERVGWIEARSWTPAPPGDWFAGHGDCAGLHGGERAAERAAAVVISAERAGTAAVAVGGHV
jgi:hypothetical protein